MLYEVITRWLDYRDVPEDEERRHIQRTVEIIERVCGKRPVGWYTGRVSGNTRRLVREEGGLLYSSDAYNDDLPYWLPGAPPHLVIPYTLVNNDARYLLPKAHHAGDQRGYGRYGSVITSYSIHYTKLYDFHH